MAASNDGFVFANGNTTSTLLGRPRACSRSITRFLSSSVTVTFA